MRLDKCERDALSAVRARAGDVEMLCHCTGELEWWDSSTDVLGSTWTGTLVVTPDHLLLLAARFSPRPQRVVRARRADCVSVDATGRTVVVEFVDGGGVELTAAEPYAARYFADRLSRSWGEIENLSLGTADEFTVLDSLFVYEEHVNLPRARVIPTAAAAQLTARRPRPYGAATVRRPLPYPSPAAGHTPFAVRHAGRPRQGSNLRPTA